MNYNFILVELRDAIADYWAGLTSPITGHHLHFIYDNTPENRELIGAALVQLKDEGSVEEDTSQLVEFTDDNQDYIYVSAWIRDTSQICGEK